MPKQIKQKLGPVYARRSAAGRAERQAYADLRHLVSLEIAVKQFYSRSVRQALVDFARPDNSSSCMPAPDPSTLQPEAARELSQMGTARAFVPGPANTLLVVDQRINMFFGSKQKTKSVVAAEAAAFVAWREFKDNNPVGALVFNDRKFVELGPSRSRLQVMLILHDLLNQNHGLSVDTVRRSNPAMLNQILRRAQALADRNSRIILITDGVGYDRQSRSLLADLSRQNQLVTFLVYDPRQVGICNAGSFIAYSLESHSQEMIGPQITSNGAFTIPISACGDMIKQLRQGGFRRLFAPRGQGIGLGDHQTAGVMHGSSARPSVLPKAIDVQGPVPATGTPPSSPDAKKHQLLCA